MGKSKALKIKSPPTFNPRSPKQIQSLLSKNGINVPSTGEEVLSKYQATHPLVDLILQHRHKSKLQSSYITPFLENKTFPYIHPTFSQISRNESGVVTGRLASYNPNFMNLPAQSEDGKAIRKVVIARPGYMLANFDFKQADLRIWAHETHDPVYLNVFKQGEDIHESTAKLIGKERFVGKQCNLIIVNSGGPKRLMETLKISESVAREVYDVFWKTHPVSNQWRKNILWKARKNHGISQFTGWFIPIENLDHMDYKFRGYAERQAISAIIQGGTAAVAKLAMLACAAVGYIPLVQEHDALLFELGEKTLDNDVKKIYNIMQSVVKLDVPMLVDYKTGKSWGECKS